MTCGHTKRSASIALITESWCSTESRLASAERRWRSTPAKRVESATACSSRAASSAACAVCERWSVPMPPADATTPTIAKIMNGSLIDDLASPKAPESEKPAPRPLDFRDAPGDRLISIIVRSARDSGSLAQREADGEHQEGRDLVRHEPVEGAVTNADVGQRVRQLYRKLEALAEGLGEARHAGATTADVDGPHLRGRPRRRRQEGGRPLDTDGDLLTAALDHRVEVRRTIVTLEQALGFVGAKAALTLQVLT